MRTGIHLANVAALLFVGLSAAGVAHAEPTEPSPAPSPSAAPPAPKTVIDADGTYAVGTDIVAGTYNSGGPVEGVACYWKRVAGDKLVDNALTKKPQTVRIEVTDTTFTTSHCQTWVLADCGTACPPPPPPPGPGAFFGDLRRFLGPGQFAVPLP
ncbi:hypothetical protein JRC04_20845 [Mycolicibacterium sp. S2-37]|uniref:hypothetical protein n=1 Tax=Mycolicibacterium sp. S2-37 TaxID=2810297 RepID=UPI001A93E69E|nr:hypothetical protein [Mycolicibacterium sp. S2-37]MBO0679924.1 hypothetical protein [Mycolicibacterium sp. S2-37]